MTTTEPKIPETCQVAVVAGDTQLDYSLPLHAPIAMMMAALREDLRADLARLGKNAVIESLGLSETNRSWKLTRVSGTALPVEKSLAECGIGNGDVLTIKGFPTPEGYTPIVEDVIDAVANLSHLAYPDFTAATARAMGLAALPIGAVAMAAATVLSWHHGRGYASAAVAAVFALITWTGALLAKHRWSSTQLCYSLATAAIPLASAAAYTAVPATTAATSENWLAASATAAMVSILLLRLTRVGASLHTAVVTAGILGSAAFAVTTFTSIPSRETAATMVLVAGILLINAPLVAVRLARIPLPSLPAPGDPIDDADIARNFVVDEEQMELIDSSLVALEYRARASTKYLTGVLTGALAVMLAATIVLVQPMDAPYAPQCLTIALLMVATLAFRARSYRDRVHSLITFGAAYLVAATTAWSLLSHPVDVVWQIAVLTALGAIVIAGTVLAIRAPQAQLTPTTRRWLELIEQALIIAIPILVMWVNGVYALARNR